MFWKRETNILLEKLAHYTENLILNSIRFIYIWVLLASTSQHLFILSLFSVPFYILRRYFIILSCYLPIHYSSFLTVYAYFIRSTKYVHSRWLLGIELSGFLSRHVIGYRHVLHFIFFVLFLIQDQLWPLFSTVDVHILLICDLLK